MSANIPICLIFQLLTGCEIYGPRASMRCTNNFNAHQSYSGLRSFISNNNWIGGENRIKSPFGRPIGNFSNCRKRVILNKFAIEKSLQ